MSRKKKAKGQKTEAKTPRASIPPQPIARRRLWMLRLVAAVVVPLVCLLLLELILRIAGFGYPTNFLVSGPASSIQPSNHPTSQISETWVQNNQFGWRFFGPQLSRSPSAFSIPKPKPTDTVRIFVFGESAAFGDPLYRFGLPRMLEAILSLRHPGVRFEVVNAAMTGINSHAILPIARNCASAGGDVWVIYMGNNEVVGPFGAGTVFSSQSPPLPLIRATLALKSTRTGQLLDGLRQSLQKTPPEKGAWGGMMMFVKQQVRADDRRMNNVYHHFERNLSDILEAGEKSRAKIVLSTVAVNLKDCPPFASAYRAGLPEQDKARWTAFYEQGVQLQNGANHAEAENQFRNAAQIDDTFAELQFRLGTCALALGRAADARKYFGAARDFDTLRFRTDSKLNELIRHSAAAQGHQHLLLADAERAFSEASPDGCPGGDLFYEHVHLTFEGNYVLARTIAMKVEELLALEHAPTPPRSDTPTLPRLDAAATWPSPADCARRLAWTDWSKHTAFSDILARVEDPPFTAQFDHNARVAQLSGQLQKLAPALSQQGLKRALQATDDALATAPSDPFLWEQLGSLRQATGDLPGASAAAEKAAALLPSDTEAWLQLGSVLALQNQFARAVEPFRRAFALEPDNIWALQYLAQSLSRLGDREQAVREYRRALSLQPRAGLAWLGLGQTLEAAGRNDEAEACYRKALANPIHRAAERALVARFSQGRGWWEAAATNYVEAVKLNPGDPQLRVDAGQALQRTGHEPEAGRQYAEAAKLAPQMVQARFLYGLHLARTGRTPEAAEEFREATRIMPALAEARLNLATALMRLGRNAEALEQFETVLSQQPTNAAALQSVRALRAKSADAGTNGPPAGPHMPLQP